LIVILRLLILLRRVLVLYVQLGLFVVLVVLLLPSSTYYYFYLLLLPLLLLVPLLLSLPVLLWVVVLLVVLLLLLLVDVACCMLRGGCDVTGRQSGSLPLGWRPGEVTCDGVAVRVCTLLLLLFPFYVVLFNKGWFSGKGFSLHNYIFNIRHLPFFPISCCRGSPFLPPLSVSTVSAGTALSWPPRGPRNTVIVVAVIVFPLLPIPF
jgi:hypothetical protein